ncbi:MAG TPA: hypothetical protein VHT51_17050 [Micropepsaceae bacterium]|jgi:hypothetical protein|nr:hypothetical protein [Micropepsaceae bacterium]
MPLNIETFSNAVGGNAFYKAVTHPLAAEPARALLATLRKSGPVAIYDPHNLLAAFDAVYPLDGIEIAGLFVQDVSHVGRKFRDLAARPITELADCHAETVLIAGFDTHLSAQHVKPLINGAALMSFDALRLPDEMLSDKGRYLSNLNFATNFAFFRDSDGLHTRLVTANYWSAYGGKGGHIRFHLFDSAGAAIADWQEPLPGANGAIVVDSRDIRARFGLPPFTGQLFLHVVGAAGHDIVKYALDTYGDETDVLSCTHDANSWPANRYAGLPAPAEDEEIVLWVQNSHPNPIAPGEIGLNLMGDEKIATLGEAIGPFATHRLSASDLLPDARWPQQIEIRAGKHFVRPRYEVLRKNGHRHIAHPNVEREDLKLDAQLPDLGAVLGKGFILPAPVLPVDRFRSIILPTPMSTAQAHLPVKLVIYDASGREAAAHTFGNLARNESVAMAANEILNGHIDGGYGHMELVYDFDAGRAADGWLHALFRYEDRETGHAAETSFGAHMFNTLVTYKGEPQSYKGPPPGLSTRLFLRVGPAPLDTMCHLVYPASRSWHAASNTALMLMSAAGEEVARRELKIPCGGSVLWRVNETFSEAERKGAGENCYVLVRDTTCRLFGYHGLVGARAFSLDHMFGF